MTDVRELLSQSDDLTPAELVDLLAADQIQRWRRGERVPAEAYLHLHPSLAAAPPQEAIDLVFNEFVLREELGETPTVEEYLWRFPAFASHLRRQITLHQAIQNGGTAPPPEADRLSTDTPVEAAGNTFVPSITVTGYDILSEIGRGGMGVVYKAHQRSLKRTVALKMIRGDLLTDPDARARFRREAEAAARLQHPHIVQVFEVGEQARQPFIVLEYVAGGSLAEQIQGTPQAPAAAARLVEILARAMSHAHEQGIIHRDLKPGNILLTEDRRQRTEDSPNVSAGASALSSVPCRLSSTPKITDFGLAKQLEGVAASAAGRTQSGMILGTPSYMAPEQAESSSVEVGPAVDVYALGAILYELLTGRPPFKAQTPMETMLQVTNHDPVPPRRLQPAVPRDLETICVKCLRKEPGQRYASVLALADDLRRFQEGKSILARPVGRWERGRKWVRRRPALATLLAVSLIAVSSLAAGAIWHNARLQDEVRQRKRQQERAAENLQIAIDLLEQQWNEITEASMRGDPAPDLLRQNLFSQSIQFYQKLLADNDASDPTARRALGRAYYGLARVHDFPEIANHSQALAYFRNAIQVQQRLVEEFPENADYRIDLAVTFFYLQSHHPRELNSSAETQAIIREKMVSLVESLPPQHPRLIYLGAFVAEKLANEGRYREALPWLDGQIQLVEARLQQSKPSGIRQRTHTVLHTMYVARAWALNQLGEHQQALAAWDHVLAFGEVPLSPDRFVVCRVMHARTVAHLGDYRQATQEIEQALGMALAVGGAGTVGWVGAPLGQGSLLTIAAVIAAGTTEAEALYNAAAVYASAAALVRQDAQRSVVEQGLLGERYAARALALLRKVQAAGWFQDPAHLKSLETDKDLAPLRSRTDLQQFLDEVKAAAKTPGS